MSRLKGDFTDNYAHVQGDFMTSFIDRMHTFSPYLFNL